MSKNSNRHKQYAMQKNSQRNKLVRTKQNIASQTSRRSRRLTQLVKNQLSQIESQQRSTRYYQPTARSKSNRSGRRKLRSEQPSRRQKTMYQRHAKLRSVQKAFETMGVKVKITTRNYQHYFKLLEDAKITGGNRYNQILRIANQLTDLDDYEGRLYDLVIAELPEPVV